MQNGDLDDLFTGAEEDLKNAPPKPRLESERQADARAAAEALGWFSFKWSSPKHGGVLDVIYLKPIGRIVFIEYKIGPDVKPSKLQAACMALLTQCGFPCYVCHDVDDTLAALAKH